MGVEISRSKKRALQKVGRVERHGDIAGDCGDRLEWILFRPSIYEMFDAPPPLFDREF
jgi:hypothetical protein